MKWTRSAFIAVFQLFVCAIAFPATVTKLNDGVFSSLRRASSPRVVLNLPLYPRSTARVSLEEFQVWAPDGRVLIHEGDKVTVRNPPAMRYFRGVVDNDPDSFAYFSVDTNTGRVTGMVATRDARFAVDGFRRVAAHPRTQDGDDYEYMLSEADPGELRDTTDLTWQCGLEENLIVPQTAAFKGISQPLGTDGLPIAPTGITGNQKYSIKLEVETDFELYTNGGSNSTALTNYVTLLTGAVSTIYNRDLKTNVVLQTLHIYTTAADPWSQTINNGLYELGDYYHANYPAVKRSTVVMISGKNVLGGVAWEGVIGFPDFSAGGGHFGGAYAWCGGIGNGGFGVIPDPDATVGGFQYGMPAGTQNYWPLAEYAHELGHNMAGHHTHCVAISDAERIANGFTDGSPATSASNFVDHCYSHEGLPGCWAAVSDYVAGSETVFNGTIMSYCHNVFGAGFVPQSRFVFGIASEPNHHELDDYMMRVGGPLADGGNTNIVKATTATMSAITAPANAIANSAGNLASVTNVAGQTYEWTIAGGTITAGATSNSATFTAGASGNVVLRVATYGSNTCGVTDSATVPIVTGPPPTVTSLSITSGPTFGGTATTITGTGFVNGATATFGGTAADVVFVNSTTLNIVTPQHIPVGAVDVVVTNPDAQAGTKTNGFTYTLTPATTTLAAPNTGSTAGGTAVTLTGTMYFGTVSVTFGGTAAGNPVLVNSTTITCVAPPHAAGPANVVVTNGDTGTSTLTNGFTYQLPAPTVNSLTVTSGPTFGGTASVISGTGFVDGATVKLGGTAADVVFVNATTLNIITPQRTTAGAVDVVVTNPDLQTGTKTNGFTYTLTPATTLTALPNVGPIGGGTDVTITGTLYFGTVSVTFGGTPATSVNRTNATTITCTTPAHGAGPVNVVVTNGDGGTSTATNGFTYQAPPPTITSLDVANGPVTGGTTVTITGTNFVAPATVDFGGAFATGVNVVSPTSITLTTPAHAVGLVNVTVTCGGQSDTKTDAFTFDAVPLPNGDVNGTGAIDGGDVIYLVNFLFGGGPGPVGSGDVNGDASVNVLDLFYLVNFVFGGGAAPL